MPKSFAPVFTMICTGLGCVGAAYANLSHWHATSARTRGCILHRRTKHRHQCVARSYYSGPNKGGCHLSAQLFWQKSFSLCYPWEYHSFEQRHSDRRPQLSSSYSRKVREALSSLQKMQSTCNMSICSHKLFFAFTAASEKKRRKTHTLPANSPQTTTWHGFFATRGTIVAPPVKAVSTRHAIHCRYTLARRVATTIILRACLSCESKQPSILRINMSLYTPLVKS